MCRHLAYVGSPIPVAWPVLDAPHALVRQAAAPRHQGPTARNADGYGVAWYDPAAGPEPVRIRSTSAIWDDAALPARLAGVNAGALVACVRQASNVYPIEESCTAPFAAGRWLFSHNGYVPGLDGRAGEPLRAGLPEGIAVEAVVDSALVWALVRARLAAGEPPGAALAGTVADVLAEVPEAALNLLLTDGTTIAATVQGRSLFARAGRDDVVVASEPLDDDPAWSSVPPGSLVEGVPGRVSVAAL
jgi:glutamine amidotransferase